ncbi:MAG: type I-U CRISPR-associated protein Csx17 [Actinobacteria bacterium]|nr:type I-U CRISPR-associated protein Csx17 [Actinomycetota bacterium]
MSDKKQLPDVPVPGLSLDSLGNYLASLGLFRILTRKWPSTRVAWHETIFRIVSGPATLKELLDHLVHIAETSAWTPYEQNWAEAQKNSTKAKSGRELALWLAQVDEQELELFYAHAVPATRVNFNRLLGSGGNAGRRNFSDGWKKAIDAFADPNQNATTGSSNNKRKHIEHTAIDIRTELAALLLGKPTSWLLEKLNAASWFSNANKLFNSGQKPYREGRVSPWAMALACEGLVFFAGGPSRRLGARAGAVGAFPFMTYSAAPEVQDEAGRDLAEVWAPVWHRPMTLPEVRTLFARGRAEVHGRGAQMPSAFATAIQRRGVDAGISEFRRFVLGRTTSANTFEPRFEGAFRLPSTPSSQTLPKESMVDASAKAFKRILSLIERLPRDQKKGQRWQFVGLRGPIETAMLSVAVDLNNPEATRDLLDVVVATLDRVDRNRSFREKRISWKPLPVEWLLTLFADEAPSVESRLALALVSGFPKSRPFTLYRFGVEWEYGRFQHPKHAPRRWVWKPGALSCALIDVLLRRTLDWEAEYEKQKNGEEPVRLLIPASSGLVSYWLGGSLDEDLLARWMARLALFDWRFVPKEISSLASPDPVRSEASAGLLLFGLLQPLFDLRPVKLHGVNSGRDLLAPVTGARTPGAARTLANLIRVGQLDATVRFASSRYAVAGAPLAKMQAPWQFAKSERLLASILFPVQDYDRAVLIQRWLRPQRQKGEVAYG